MKTIFLIDVVNITLRLNHQWREMPWELAKWMILDRTIPADRVSRYKGNVEFKWVSFFNFKPITKVHLLHGKREARQNIDALLVLHDVPLKQLVQVGQILKRISCIKDYNLSSVEFRWDFYLEGSAIKFQRQILQHLFLLNARIAFDEGDWPRKTFYINSRANDAFLKVYIRPKKTNTGNPEFIRIELTAKRRWLRNAGLRKPTDFLGFKIEGVLGKIKWLDIDQEKVIRAYVNLFSGGLLAKFINNTLLLYGIGKVIVQNRKMRECPEKCPDRANQNRCPLARALQKSVTGINSLNEILSCPKAKPIADFVTRYCKESSTRHRMNAIMKGAYMYWRGKDKRVSLPLLTRIKLAANERIKNRKTKSG